DLHRERVRAAVPRHAHGGAAAPGPAGPLRDRGPVPARAGTRHDLPVRGERDMWRHLASVGQRARPRRAAIAGLLILTPTRCAAQSAQMSEGYRPAATAAPDQPTSQQTSVAGRILGVLVTPLYLGFKIVVCAATVAFAAPATAIAAISDPHATGWQRTDLNEG